MKITSSKFQSLYGKKKPNKFGAIRTKVDGINFHSKVESEYYLYLKSEKEKCNIEYFLMQVPFQLVGCKYICDFAIFYECGSVRYVDIKGGPITPMSKLKIKQTEQLYPVTIEIVRKGEF